MQRKIGDDHPKQAEIFRDTSRFRIAVCGRRFGKTVLGTEEALRAAYDTPKGKIWIIGPTREMVKELFWTPLLNRCRDLRWKIKLDGTYLRIVRTANYAQIVLKSADRIDRLRGHGLHLAIMDEYADMDAELWPEVIRPALTDTMGKALFIGTPKGRTHFYELYQRAAEYPEWKRWNFRTVDNPHINASEIEAARMQLDDRTFRQEYEADFVEYLGRAYCYFDPDSHVRTLPLDKTRPLVVCLDFNLDPCIWEIAQDSDRLTYVIDEISSGPTDIWRMCALLKQRLEALLGSEDARGHRLQFFGDYTSVARRDVSAIASSWEIIRSEFKGWNCDYFPAPNPRIMDRVNAVNSRHRSADGKTHFACHPRCVELKMDFETVDMEMLTTAKKDAGRRTHASDAVGYFLAYRYPVVGAHTRIM